MFFQLGKTCKEIPFLANNFTLSDVEDNISRLLNRGGIAGLHLLRVPFAICQSLESQVFLK